MKYIIAFQKQNSLYPDGVVGPKTLNKIGDVFDIKNAKRISHFMGQVGHESTARVRGSYLPFSTGSENLNYSVRGLMSTFLFFRKNPDLAKKYGRIRGVQKANQEAIANIVYADENRSSRYKLGNTRPGDGWRFKGKGGIMVTGRANTERFFKWMGLPIDTDPQLLETKYFWHTALWYFEENNLWRICDQMTRDSIVLLTKKINGGDNGLDHRINLTSMFYKMID